MEQDTFLKDQERDCLKRLLKHCKDEREGRLISKAFIKEVKGTDSLADATYLNRKRRQFGLDKNYRQADVLTVDNQSAQAAESASIKEEKPIPKEKEVYNKINYVDSEEEREKERERKRQKKKDKEQKKLDKLERKEKELEKQEEANAREEEARRAAEEEKKIASEEKSKKEQERKRRVENAERLNVTYYDDSDEGTESPSDTHGKKSVEAYTRTRNGKQVRRMHRGRVTSGFSRYSELDDEEEENKIKEQERARLQKEKDEKDRKRRQKEMKRKYEEELAKKKGTKPQALTAVEVVEEQDMFYKVDGETQEEAEKRRKMIADRQGKGFTNYDSDDSQNTTAGAARGHPKPKAKKVVEKTKTPTPDPEPSPDATAFVEETPSDRSSSVKTNSPEQNDNDDEREVEEEESEEEPGVYDMNTPVMDAEIQAVTGSPDLDTDSISSPVQLIEDMPTEAIVATAAAAGTAAAATTAAVIASKEPEKPANKSTKTFKGFFKNVFQAFKKTAPPPEPKPDPVVEPVSDSPAVESSPMPAPGEATDSPFTKAAKDISEEQRDKLVLPWKKPVPKRKKPHFPTVEVTVLPSERNITPPMTVGENPAATSEETPATEAAPAEKKPGPKATKVKLPEAPKPKQLASAEEWADLKRGKSEDEWAKYIPILEDMADQNLTDIINGGGPSANTAQLADAKVKDIMYGEYGAQLSKFLSTR